ncbi:LacI family DNA-binding transcriptional regulator [Intrasporangium sp.]|uniref:LacI family DNA-binding transcriptional regulator n=1 Tax=Intrasporangium sp. TaxID=1925024 RepID=UPI0032220BA9
MPPQRQASSTLRDVAERAHVSLSTASLVFSGKGPVATETAERVRAAAAELGYLGPNPLASSLRQGRSGVVGVVVEGRVRHAFQDPFAVSVLDGLAEVLDTIPTGLLLVGQSPDDPDALLRQLGGLALDAVVFALCGLDRSPAVDYLAARRVPMVGTSAPVDRRVTQVRVDERAAGATIARYVHDLGHRRVAHVAMQLTPGSPAGPAPRAVPRSARYVAAFARLRGFRDVFGPAAEVVQTGDGPGFEEGRAAGRALLDRPRSERPTAIVAQSDVIAAGVVLAAEELGLQVPEELSVTGFDGVRLPWLAHRLTTMDQHGHDKGRLLGTLVKQALDGTRPRSRTEPVELREGTTTAPWPPAGR